MRLSCPFSSAISTVLPAINKWTWQQPINWWINAKGCRLAFHPCWQLFFFTCCRFEFLVWFHVSCHLNETYLTYFCTKIEAEENVFLSSTWSKVETHVELVVLYLVEGVSIPSGRCGPCHIRHILAVWYQKTNGTIRYVTVWWAGIVLFCVVCLMSKDKLYGMVTYSMILFNIKRQIARYDMVQYGVVCLIWNDKWSAADLSFAHQRASSPYLQTARKIISWNQSSSYVCLIYQNHNFVFRICPGILLICQRLVNAWE